MRGSARQRRHEEEEESVFVSMTDMTVGFLFIVILLLAFFASQYNPSQMVPKPEYDQLKEEHQTLQAQHRALQVERDALLAEIERLRRQIEILDQKIAELEEQIARLKANVTSLTDDLARAEAERDRLAAELAQAKSKIAGLETRVAELETELDKLRQPDPLETYINQSLAERRRILEQLRDKISIDFPELKVVLSEESDALRFQGDGLFRSGSARLRPDRIAFVETVAAKLEELLPCYTLGQQSRHRSDCNSGFALIEAVQIEGHTDADGGDMTNLSLSTARANDTFRAMTEHEPMLVDHLNFKGQPVLSVAGYGKMRPVADNGTVEGKASNRRIDLRIIMYVPARSEEIEKVRIRLNAQGAQTP